MTTITQNDLPFLVKFVKLTDQKKNNNKILSYMTDLFLHEYPVLQQSRKIDRYIITESTTLIDKRKINSSAANLSGFASTFTVSNLDL